MGAVIQLFQMWIVEDGVIFEMFEGNIKESGK
jgi:hypothetical protein